MVWSRARGVSTDGTRPVGNGVERANARPPSPHVVACVLLSNSVRIILLHVRHNRDNNHTSPSTPQYTYDATNVHTFARILATRRG